MFMQQYRKRPETGKSSSDLCTTQVKFSRGITAQQILEFAEIQMGMKNLTLVFQKPFWAQLQTLAESNQTILVHICCFHWGGLIQLAPYECPMYPFLFHFEHWLFFAHFLATLAIACASIKYLPTTCHSQLENVCTAMHFCISN